MTLLHVTELQCAREIGALFQPISFLLQAGEILQISGPNGSGKSTLLRCLAGLVQPYSGQVSFREDLGTPLFIGHKNAIKSSLTPIENLKWLLENKSEADFITALERMGLKEQLDKLAGSFSAGQKQRLALTKLVLSSARLWILDEPFTALDAAGIELVQDLMKEHLHRQGSIVLTSHQILSQTFAQYRNLSLQPSPADTIF